MVICFSAILHGKQILHRSNLIPNQSASNSTDVPKGYLAVYVGEGQKKRYIYISKLLRKCEEEFGFNHPLGGITIPCRDIKNENLTSCLKRKSSNTILYIIHSSSFTQ
uniref:Small auxin-up RNA n=1 Tax=Manihot esculenta TaxID=3983 RepID=A0A2C9W0I3_MANES